jgi:hypothetical protein
MLLLIDKKIFNAISGIKVIKGTQPQNVLNGLEMYYTDDNMGKG